MHLILIAGGENKEVPCYSQARKPSYSMDMYMHPSILYTNMHVHMHITHTHTCTHANMLRLTQIHASTQTIFT